MVRTREFDREDVLDRAIRVFWDDKADRELGCMGVNAICEFGTTDPGLIPLRCRVGPMLGRRLAARIRDGQARGEIDATVSAGEAAAFIQMTMQGIQFVARAGDP